MIGPLVLKLCSPFEISNAVQDERFWYAPVVCGYLEYDNSHNDETAEVVFGVSGEAPARGANSASGFDFDGTHGFATASTAEVRAARTGDVVSSDAGPVSALLFTVPAASKRIFPLVLGFFHPGFFYTELFSGLRDVLDFGLLNHAQYLACADALDAEFMRSQAPFDQKTSGAHALRSWLATSRRLAGQPALDVDPLRALWRSLVAPN